MRIIDLVVNKMIKDYPEGGTKYFNKLDETLKLNESLQLAMLAKINTQIRSRNWTLVTQGEFSMYLLKTMYDYDYPDPPECRIQFRYSIRKDQEPIIRIFGEPQGPVIFMDDSAYSMKTIDGVYMWMASYMSVCINRIIVMYDGIRPSNPLLKSYSVESLYRYYDYHAELPKED